MNLQTGAFGDPTQLQTLIIFWTKMELLHYPGAAETKAQLEEQLKQQQAAQMPKQGTVPGGAVNGQGMPKGLNPMGL